MMKTMEKIMDKLSADDKNQMKDQREPQVRNPNFKRHQGPHVPQVMPRGKRSPNEQKIRPPFQENLIDEEIIKKPQDHTHNFGNELKESKTFVTTDEHDSFVLQKEEDDQDLVEEEFEDNHKAYLNAMMDLQKKYNLRRRNVVVDPPKKAPQGQASTSQHAKN